MMSPGTRHYGEPFGMEGYAELRVEARLLGVPGHPPALATVEVQGTGDGAAKRKCWVVEGDVLTLRPGVWERRTLRGVRPQVRVVAATSGSGHLEIRFMRSR